METGNLSSGIPKRGFAGLLENWKTDVISGLLVFLLALPLSLGIAKASGFPPAMGVLTAMIGGMFGSFFRVSELTIKGPAAGLITVCAGAVADFGGGEQGWRIACAAIVVMAVLQVALGYLKMGSLSDLFPHSAVHGMLAAIGLIIISKQIPVLLGDDPMLYKGETPIQLFLDIPKFIANAHWHIAAVGLSGLAVLIALPRIKIGILKKIPPSMFVLVLTVPMALLWHFRQTEPPYALVEIGDFWGSLGFNADFSAAGTLTFWKYVVMFLFVSSLESLLTVKATDKLDPWKRESDYNGDLKAQGFSNAAAGFLGGLPMISEVVRSSSNVNFGARTKWSNFFHGVFLLLAMILMIPLIEMIPNSALAAMLIFAGYRLAAPREFIHTYRIGKEQIAIFVTTILVTLLEDLLLGVAAGILVKIFFHWYNGARISELFKADFSIDHRSDGSTRIEVRSVAAFTNVPAFKKAFQELPDGHMVLFDVSKARLLDHSFLAYLSHYAREFNAAGGRFEILGLDSLYPLSDHPLATRVNRTGRNGASLLDDAGHP